jgi:hypothetical protein
MEIVGHARHCDVFLQDGFRKQNLRPGGLFQWIQATAGYTVRIASFAGI